MDDGQLRALRQDQSDAVAPIHAEAPEGARELVGAGAKLRERVLAHPARLVLVDHRQTSGIAGVTIADGDRDVERRRHRPPETARTLPRTSSLRQDRVAHRRPLLQECVPPLRRQIVNRPSRRRLTVIPRLVRQLQRNQSVDELLNHRTLEPTVTWPNVIYSEEVIREGFGIEDVGIPRRRAGRAAGSPLRDRPEADHRRRLRQPEVRAADGVLRGAAASVPPMPGVTYLPFIHNQKAQETAPSSTPRRSRSKTRSVHAVPRHLRHSPAPERQPLRSSRSMAHWPQAIEDAQNRGVARRQDRHRLRMGLQLPGEVRPALPLLLP